MSPMGMLIYILGLGAVFYFILIRPQKKQQERRAEVLNRLQVGDEIITIGGIVGKITEIGNLTMKIDIGNGVEMEFLKTAIASTKDTIINNDTEEEVSIDDLEEYMDDADTVQNDTAEQGERQEEK